MHNLDGGAKWMLVETICFTGCTFSVNDTWTNTICLSMCNSTASSLLMMFLLLGWSTIITHYSD
jgi:hypothetical protein